MLERTSEVRGIKWPDTALDSQGIKNRDCDHIMIECFHNHPKMIVPSAFMFRSIVKGPEDFRVGDGIERDEIRLICIVVKPKIQEVIAEIERRMIGLEPSKLTNSI